MFSSRQNLKIIKMAAITRNSQEFMCNPKTSFFNFKGPYLNYSLLEKTTFFLGVTLRDVPSTHMTVVKFRVPTFDIFFENFLGKKKKK